ncbi:MAG: thioredoxin family protein [Armatimonadetes bacterium]|nr:thioredoxin family protein [Armatimonadota bacterium]
MKRWMLPAWAAAMALAALVPPLAAQGFLSGPDLEVAAAASVDRARPGDTFQIAVALDLPEGVHVNAHVPSSPDLIPTTVTIAAPAGLRIGAITYPEGRELKLSFSPTPLSVYEGRTVFRASVAVAQSAAPGEAKIEGSVRAQACKDDACFPPRTIPFSLTIPVAPAGSAVQPARPDLFGSGSAPAPPEASAPTSGGTPAAAAGSRARAPRLTRGVSASEFVRWLETGTIDARDEGAAGRLGGLLRGGRWLLALPLIYLAGLALNLTPCVYPLIPITIAYFGGQAGGSKGRTVTLAALYVLGMAIMYSALGTTASLTASLFGSQLQSPYVLAGFAAVMVALGLSMFGVWEMRLPSALTSRVSARAGHVGAVVMGLLVGIVAAPCVGPAVVALLQVVGQIGKPALGFAVFFSLALGLGTPYLVLGSFSGLIQKLPRSGEWMNAVKRVFGLVMFWMALYYLGPLLGPRTHALALGLYTFVAGIYLLFLDATGRGARRFFLAKRGAGAAAALAALWMVVPRGQARVGIPFEAYSEARVEQALGEGKRVLVDFRADWCAVCKEMEATTFRDPRVVAATRDLVALQEDLTHVDDTEAERLRREYGIAGLPHIVLLTPPVK